MNRRSQRGAAALLVTLMLFLAMALGALGVQRQLVFESRSSVNQARSAQAFEAAEAGLIWAQARLNDTRRIDSACEPQATAPSFRERTLILDHDSGAITATGALPACVRGASGWSCACPESGAGRPRTTDDDAASFALQFLPASRGSVRVVADGCAGVASSCGPSGSASTDATARVEVTLALAAGLRTPPLAALTTRNAETHTPDQFFAATFGVARTSWRDQPVAARVRCDADCAGAIGAAIDAGHDLIWIDGDATLASAIRLGATARPIAIAATGAVHLDAPLTLVGVLYAASVSVSASGAVVQGAVLTEAPSPDAPEFRYDAGVLTALARRSGSFARVSGSWRDF